MILGLYLSPPALAQKKHLSGDATEIIKSLSDSRKTAQKSGIQRDNNKVEKEEASSTIAPTDSTRQELKIRDFHATEELKRLHSGKSSIIEQDYSKRLGRSSRQFGYDMFTADETVSGYAPTGEISSSYILGVGDEVIVTFKGTTQETFSSIVDSQGRINIGNLKPITAAGRSFRAVKLEIQAETRKTMLSTQALVSIGNVRLARVYVGGEVQNPGLYTLSSLSDVIQALSLAGGIKKTGSLRRVYIERSGNKMRVDLYGIMGIGRYRHIQLQEGDKIIVPLIGKTIAIAGNIPRPGIFELLPITSSLTIGQVFEMTGLPVRPSGNRFIIGRISKSGIEYFLTTSKASDRIYPGDALRIIPHHHGEKGRVTLSGRVRYPGYYALNNAPTVAKLLGGELSNLPDYTYLPYAIMVRKSSETLGRTINAINLIDVFHKKIDIPLQEEDTLIILNNSDLKFLQSSMVQKVLQSGSTSSNCKALKTLANRIQLDQGSAFTSALKVENVSVAQAEKKTKNTHQFTAQKGIGETGCATVFEAYPESLAYTLEHALFIGGDVRNPGTYPIAGQISLKTALDISGGLLSRKGKITATRISRSSPSDNVLEKEQEIEVIDYANFDREQLHPGDDIRFNNSARVIEGGTVLLSGAFINPGLYAIAKGEKISSLIKRAGGFNAFAYPQGAVITRQAIKETQSESLKRTAQEMMDALVTIMARRQYNSSNAASDMDIEGLSQLVDMLTNIEPSGRLVAEVDPEKIAQNPELGLILQPNDHIMVPEKPSFVLVLGDVLNVGALQHKAGRTARDYIIAAGGMKKTADKKRAFIVYPNGEAQPVKMASRGGWFYKNQKILPPGSTIIVPKNMDPLKSLFYTRVILEVLSKLGTTAASLAILSKL